MTNLTLSAVYTYPVKSCAGIASDRMILEEAGPRYDRRWMVVIQEDGHWQYVSQREAPQLALIQPSIMGDHLILQAKRASELRIPLEGQNGEAIEVTIRKDTMIAADEGHDAQAWFSDHLHSPVKLVRMPESTIRPVNPLYAIPPAHTTFTDGYPILIISEASLASLNDRLIEREVEPMDMRRFRPNWVVKGARAFEEDSWKKIRVNGIVCEVVKPCPRCVMTTVDPALGEVLDPHEPLATLNTFRRSAEGKVMFGQNVIHRGLGEVCVGDVIEVLA
jgi:hypothetical protein